MLVIIKQPTPQNMYGNKSEGECDKLFLFKAGRWH